MDDLFAPVEEQDLFAPVEEEPLFAPVEEQNLFAPVEEEPLFAPVEEQQPTEYTKLAGADREPFPVRETDEAGVDEAHAFQSIDQHLMGQTAAKPAFQDAKLVQGQEPGLWDKFTGLFKDTQAGSAKDAMAVALSQDTGKAPSEVLAHFDQVSQEVAHDLGLKTQLSPEEYYHMVITTGGLAMSGSIATTKALWSVAKGLGIFTGLDYAKGAAIRAYTGDDMDNSIADLMSPDSSSMAKGFVKGIEFAGEALAAGGLSHPSGLKKVFADISQTARYKAATVRERFGMVSDVGLMIDAMRASGKSEGQIIRQIRRKYGPESKVAQEAWEIIAVRTGRVVGEGADRPKPTNSPNDPVTGNVPATAEVVPNAATEKFTTPGEKGGEGVVKPGEGVVFAPVEATEAKGQAPALDTPGRGKSIPVPPEYPATGEPIGAEDVETVRRRAEAKADFERASDPESPIEERASAFERYVENVARTEDEGIYDLTAVRDVDAMFSGLPPEVADEIISRFEAKTQEMIREYMREAHGMDISDVDSPAVAFVYGQLDGKSLATDYPGAFRELRQKFGPGLFRSKAKGGLAWDELADMLKRRGLIDPEEDLVDLLRESKGINEKRQEFGVFHDVGGEYATMEERMAAAAKRESVSGPGTGVKTEPVEHVRLELPDLVWLHQQILDGKFPKVAEHLSHNARGSFHTGKGETRILAEIFKDPVTASKTLAHEIGHIVDWLPDRMPGLPRGNILGRIKSAKMPYLKHFMEGFKGGPGPLTPKERARMRYEAKKLVEKGETWVDEEITKTMPVTPEDVLGIWDNTMAKEKVGKGLYNAIAGMSSAEKKSVIKAAMKGVVPEELQQYAKTLREKTGNKVKVEFEATPEMVKQKYRDLITEEILKRRLLSKDAVSEELKRFTNLWKPIPANATPEYIKYRHNSAELYADAFSALLTDPEFLAQEAPVFYNSFLNFMEEKPAFAEVWSSIREELTTGKKISARRSRVRRDFREQTAKSIKSMEEVKVSRAEDLAIKFIDRAWRIQKDVKKVVAEVGDIPHSKNPYLSIERWLYSGASKEGYQTDMLKTVFEPLRKAGGESMDLSEYLFHRRVVEERGEIANPYGMTPKASQEILDDIMASPKGPAIKRAADAFWEARKEWFIDEVAKSGLFSKELVNKMIGNQVYARFEVVKQNATKKMGSAFANMVFGQKGTLQGISDPLFATIASDIRAISSVAKQKAMRDTAEFYKLHFPHDIKKAKQMGRGRFEVPTDASGMGMIGYLEDGKPRAFYVPKNVARPFESLNEHGLVTAFYNMTMPFRKVFVDYNPSFALRNPLKDLPSAIKILPGATLRNFIPFWIKAFPQALGRARGKELSPTIRMMLHEHSLIAPWEYRGRLGQTEFVKKLFEQSFTEMSPPRTLGGAWTALKRKKSAQYAVWPLAKVFEALSLFTQATEGMSKIAAHNWLRTHYPDMPPELRSHIVRESGSPRFLVKGEWNQALEAFTPFYNPFKEGMRTQFRAMSRNKWDYFKKTFQFNISPRLLMRLATLGVLGGVGMKAAYDRITDYDKSNYLVVPIGVKNGETVYVRIPQDEFGRMLGNIETTIWNLATDRGANPGEILSVYTGLMDVTFQNTPGFNPMVSLLFDAGEFIGGGIPYDSYRGQGWFTEDVNRSESRRTKGFLRGAAERYGLKSFVDLTDHDPKDMLDQVYRVPILGPTVKAFVKKSDYGVHQRIEREWEKREKLKAEARLLSKDAIRKLARKNPRDLTQEEMNGLLLRIVEQGGNRVGKEFIKTYARETGSVWLREIINAPSKEKKRFIIDMMAEDPLADQGAWVTIIDILLKDEED